MRAFRPSNIRANATICHILRVCAKCGNLGDRCILATPAVSRDSVTHLGLDNTASEASELSTRDSVFPKSYCLACSLAYCLAQKESSDQRATSPCFLAHCLAYSGTIGQRVYCVMAYQCSGTQARPKAEPVFVWWLRCGCGGGKGG